MLAEDTRRTRILLDRHGDRRAAGLAARAQRGRADRAGARGARGGRVRRAGLRRRHAARLGPGRAAGGARRSRPDTPWSRCPGASAVLAALASRAFRPARFAFVGFLPRRARERDACSRRWRERAETLVLFESPRRVAATLRALAEVLGDAAGLRRARAHQAARGGRARLAARARRPLRDGRARRGHDRGGRPPATNPRPARLRISTPRSGGARLGGGHAPARGADRARRAASPAARSTRARSRCARRRPEATCTEAQCSRSRSPSSRRARLVEDLDAELAAPSRACCRARRRPRRSRLLRDRGRDLAAARLDAPLRLGARHARERAGEHEGLARERPARAPPTRLRRAASARPPRGSASPRRALRASAKKRATLSAIVGPSPGTASSSSRRGGEQRVEIAEAAREQLGHALADVADAERDQEARERGVLRALELGREVRGRLLAHPLEAGERRRRRAGRRPRGASRRRARRAGRRASRRARRCRARRGSARWRRLFLSCAGQSRFGQRVTASPSRRTAGGPQTGQRSGKR